jgi:hypothetical protein
MFKDVEDKREAFVAADMMLSVRPASSGSLNGVYQIRIVG